MSTTKSNPKGAYSDEIYDHLSDEFLDKMINCKTFEEACIIEGLESKKVIPEFEFYPEADRKAMQAHAKMVIVVKAINRLASGNQPWKVDFDEGYHYENWYRKDSSSSGFRFFDCAYWYSGSCVGSRLCFVSREAGEYFARQFKGLINEYFL